MHHWMHFLNRKNPRQTPDLPPELLLSVARWFAVFIFVLGPIASCLLGVVVVLVMMGAV